MAQYTFNNTPFLEEELLEIADSKGYTLEELFEKNPGIKETDPDPDEEGKETPSQETVDATVEVNGTASNLENGSLGSQEIDNSPEAIKARREFNRQEEIAIMQDPIELEEVEVSAKKPKPFSYWKDLVLTSEYEEAFEQLSKDTGKFSSTGAGGIQNIIDYFSQIPKLVTPVASREEESKYDPIDIDLLTRIEIAKILTPRELDKLKKGGFNLKEKEQLLNKAKTKIVRKTLYSFEKDIENDFAQLNNEQKIIQNRLVSTFGEIEPSSRDFVTQASADLYNNLNGRLNDIQEKKKDIANEYTQVTENLKSNYGFDLATGVFENNFKLTDEVKDFNKKVKENGLAKLGAKLVGGIWKTASDIVVFPGILMALAGDSFNDAIGVSDEDTYSEYDMFKDILSNVANYNTLGDTGKARIVDDKGNLIPFSKNPSEYLDTTLDMLPFTLGIMASAMRGNVNNIQKKMAQAFSGKGVYGGMSNRLKQEISMFNAAYAMTFNDNLLEGKDLGLTDKQAMVYANTMSLGTSVSQAIMPDINFLKGITGAELVRGFTGNLRTAANKKALGEASKQFFTGIGKEVGEEEFEFVIDKANKMAFGLSLGDWTDFVGEQKQLLAGTFMLSGGLGSVGAIRTNSIVKKEFYNGIVSQQKTLLNNLQLQQSIAKSEGNFKAVEQLEKARIFVTDIIRASKVSPQNVTADQLDLVVKKQKLIDEKKNLDSSFHGPIDEQIATIDNQIAESKITTTKAEVGEKLKKGVDALGKKLGFKTTRLKNNKETEDYLNKVAPDKDNVKKAGNFGFFVQKPDGTKEIVINEDANKKAGVITTEAHEGLHYILSETLKSNPGAQQAFGKALLNELEKIDQGQIANSEYAQRLQQYLIDPKISEGNALEEALTLFSEATLTGDIVYNENIITKIGDFIRQTLQSVGLEQAVFNEGRDIFNFIKDYNNSIKKGRADKFITDIATKGAVGKLTQDQAVEQAETVIKESRSEEASNKVQELYEQKGVNGALEIIEQFKPITNKIVEQRKNAPGFDRQLLTDEIETGAGGILDLIQAYDPSSNVPLAAYINKFLPVRAITASRRILEEEFAGDIAEAPQVAAEAAPETEVKAAPTKAKKQVKKETLSTENQQALEDVVADLELTEDELTFKTLPNAAIEVFAKQINIPAKKFAGKANFTQAELGKVITFIEENIDIIRQALPQAAVLEGAPVSEGLIGTATGVPNNLLKDPNLYTRKERTTKKAGLVPYEKNKGIDNSSILKAIGIIEGKRTAGPRDKQAQTAKGLINVLAKFATNQEVRQQKDLTPQQKTDIETGKGSRILFSRSFKGAEKIDPQIIKLGKKLNTRLTKKAIDNALVEMRNEFDGTEELFLEYKEKYFDPYIKARKKADKMPWPNAEETVLKNIKALEKSVPGLKITQVGLNKNSQKVDIEFKLNGQEVFIEVKKNEKARLSQIFLRKNSNGNTYVTKGRAEEKYINEIIKKDLKSRNILLDIINEKYPNEIFEEKDGNDVKTVVTRDAFYGGLNALKEQNKSSEKVFQLPIDFVNSIYNAKNTYYLDFGDLGTFYMNENPQQFPIASLAQKNKDGKLIEVDVRMMWKHHKPRIKKKKIEGFKEPKTVFTISRIATPSLTVEAKQVLSNTETLSMQEEGQAAVILKFSKSKTEATTKNNKELPKKFQLPKGSTNEQVLAKMQELDNEANEARIKYSKSQNLDEAFNDIIEAKTGIETYKRFSPGKAAVRGASKGKFNFFIPPSAEDFVGLLYKTLAKGKLGDRQMQWYKDNLLDPYARAMNDISSARVAMFEDYKKLKEDLKVIPKDLKKKSFDEYTREHAARVYIWNKQGNKIPGLYKTDTKKLVDYVNNDPELKLFADQLIAMQKNDGYSAPKEGWLDGSITTDLLESVNSIKRKKYLEQWQNNVDEIFSEVNMNKLQAAFGKPYREALENILKRMQTGRNKPFRTDTLAGRVTDWLNNSVGAIMFFNTRSAVLQTISSINFVNWSDNNIYQAGKAFANQPQYWKDFKFLFNSDFLKERRGGSRFNVAESDIADAAKQGGARGVISKILQAGFLPTQVADSFAIASGGATFYRNRINSYIKEGLTETEAQEKAFLDFREIAEEAQQSSRPDRISAQQAGALGRVVLAFANTPAQYARLTKKAVSDLVNGRGDAKTNLSKLLYYGFVQNLIFNMLQKATFLLAFGDEDEDEKKKEKAYLSTINGIADGFLRGIGIGGAAVSTIKNVLIKISENASDPVSDVLDFSPPISSKYDKLQRAYRTYKWNKEEIKEKGFSLDSPAYEAGANVISAVANVPLDRVVKKVNNIVDATQENITPLERAMLVAGWSEWELGIQKPKEKKKKKTRSRGRGTSRSNNRSSNRR